MVVSWAKCVGEVFCGLETVNLSDVRTRGVYVIWHNPSRRVVYVGEGWIAERLSDHQADPRILGHRGSGSLLVTWAEVEEDGTRWGIERYLGESWSSRGAPWFQSGSAMFSLYRSICHNDVFRLPVHPHFLLV